MSKKLKPLHEGGQLLEQRISELENQLSYYRQRERDSGNSINPLIANRCTYNTVLQTQDIIQATNRYITYIPELNLPSQKLETLWYFYGSLCFFLYKGELKIGTYAKGGELNGIGDLNEAEPIDFAGKSYGFKRTVVYTNKPISNPCVIINDYTGTWREGKIIPRAVVNRVSINDQSFIYRQMITSVRLTIKKAIALIDGENQRETAIRTLKNFFNDDNPFTAINGKDLNNVFKIFNLDTKLDIEGYVRAIDSFLRLRSNFNGMATRSDLDKKERLITAEAENDNCLTELYLQDGLMNRQVGIEFLKIHKMIKDGSCKINPILDYSTKVESRGENDDRNNNV